MNDELLINAKPSRRIFAVLFDLFLTLIVSSIILLPAVLAFVDVIYHHNTESLRIIALFVSSLISGALIICLDILYFVCLPVIWEGQTIGKRLFKIRIIDIYTNEGPNAKTMLLREAFRIIIFIVTIGLSAIASSLALILSENHTTFHEQLSSTRVVNVNIYQENRSKNVDVD